MADEILGNLSVNITGDYSELSDAIDQATSDATQGATEIANAFNVPDAGSALAASISAIGDAAEAASGDVASFGQAAQSSVDGASALSDAAAPLAGSLNDAGDAANSAGGSLGGFGDNASQAAGDAQEAEGGVQGLAEQFVALGEALAVTEGLKEFGQEALTAYGTVQSVTIGLTQLTKSAEQADEIVTQIKELAATEPFAFPEIAPTIQKMVALGVSAEQIPGVMQAVADAAAATGNQFSQVANSFDRMTLSGTVSARSLVQLGVNTQQLGAAMGVAADQVKAAFLAMDQTDRINILEAAMGKFAGAAEAQAQGIAGQWQIFENTFEEVMVGVGEALAPIVGDILSFGKTVLEETQSAITAFNELPEPVKEVAVAIGLLVAATVPALALASSLGFAWLGLQQAGNLVTVILQKIGVTGGEAAAGEEAAAQGARDLAAAEAEAGAAGATASGGIGAAGLAAGALGTSARTVQGPLTELGTAVEDLGLAGTEASGGIVLFEQATAGMTASAANAAAGYSALGMSVGGLAAVFAGPIVASILVTQSNLEDLKQKWDDVVGEVETRTLIKALQTGDPTAQINALGLSMDGLKAKVFNASTAGATLGQQLEQSAQQPLTALGNLNIDLSQVANALKGMQAGGANVFAALANSPTFSQFEQNIQTLGGDLDKILAKINALAPSVSAYGNTLGITVVTQQSFDKGLQDLTANQVKLNTAVTQAQGVLNDANAALSKLKPGMDGYSLASQVASDAQLALDKAQTAASGSAKAQSDSVETLTQKLDDAQTKANNSISIFQNLSTTYAGNADAIGLIDAAYKKATTSAAAAGIAFASAAGEAAKQQIAFDQASASTQAMQDALGGLIIQYYAAVAAGNDTSSIQQQIALSYKAVEAEVAKTGGTYENATAQLIALNVAGNNAQSALTGQAAVWTELASATNKTADQQAQMAAVFKTVQTDAAAVGLTVTQVGNSLIYAAAPGIKMDAAVQGLLTTLNAAAIASGNFVTIGGKLVPTLSALADAASGANAGIGGMNATINAAGVIISGLGTAATTAAPQVAAVGTAAQNTGAQAQNAGTQIINLNKNMDGIYETVFTGAPVVTQFGNAIKGLGTAAQGAGPQIINLNKNMDGIYETVFTGAPVVTQFGSALTSAGKSAQGAASSVGAAAPVFNQFATDAIINGVRFANWNDQLHQAGLTATAAVQPITSVGTATTNVGDSLVDLPMRADLAATGFTDVATAAAQLPAKFTSVDGAISVMGDSLGEGNQSLITFQQQAQNTDGSISNITVSVTGLEDPLDVMGSAAQMAATHIQTMGQYATTCGDECGDLTDDVTGFTDAAPAAVSAANNIATGFDAMASAAYNATTAVNTLAAADAKLSAASGGSSGSNDNNFGFSLGGDNILTGGNSTPSQTASGSIPPTAVSQTINGATITGGWSPPPDPNPGRDHLVDNASTVGPDTNPYSWVADTTPTPAAAAASASAPAAATPLGNQPVTPVATVPAAVDNTVATQANTAATTANTGATAAATPATAADTAATQANTAATTPDTTATVANTAATQADTVAATAAAPALASVATSAGNTSTALASTATASGDVTTDLGALDTAVTQLARDEGTLDQATAQLAQDTGALDTGFQALVKDSGGFDQALQSLVTDAGNLDKAFQALVTDGGGSSGLDGVFQSLVKDGGNSSGLDGVFQALVTDGGNLDKDFQALTTDAGNLDQALQNLVTDAGNLDQALQNLVSAISNATSSAGSSTGSSAPGSTGSTGSAAPSGSAPNIPGSWQWNGVAWVNAATGDQWVFQNGAWVNLGNPNVQPLAAVPGTTPTTSTSSFPLGNQPGAPNVYGLGTTPGTSPTGPPPGESGTWTWNGSAWVQVGGATAPGASTGTGGGSTGPVTSQFENPGTDANGNPLFQQQGYAGYNGIDYSTAPSASTGTGGGLTGPVTSSNFENAVAGQQVGYAGYNGIDYSTAPGASTGTGGGLSGSSGNQTLTQAQINALADAGNSGTPTPLIDPNAIVTGLTEAQLEQDYPQIAEMNYGNPDLYGNYPITNAPSSLTPTSPAINLTVNINAGTVVGSNAAQQLVNMVMPQMVAQLRQAGVKI